MHHFRILTWNIHGLGRRWRLLRDVVGMLQPDVVCLQDVGMPFVHAIPDRSSYWNVMMQRLGFAYTATPELPPPPSPFEPLAEDLRNNLDTSHHNMRNPQRTKSSKFSALSKRSDRSSLTLRRNGWCGVLIASRHKPLRTWSWSLAGDIDGRHVAMDLTSDWSIHSVMAPEISARTVPKFLTSHRNKDQSDQPLESPIVRGLIDLILRKRQFMSELVSELTRLDQATKASPQVVLCGGLGLTPDFSSFSAPRESFPGFNRRNDLSTPLMQHTQLPTPRHDNNDNNDNLSIVARRLIATSIREANDDALAGLLERCHLHDIVRLFVPEPAPLASWWSYRNDAQNDDRSVTRNDQPSTPRGNHPLSTPNDATIPPPHVGHLGYLSHSSGRKDAENRVKHDDPVLRSTHAIRPDQIWTSRL